MCRSAPGVHDPLRNAFVIEMRNLLSEMEIFHQGGAADAGPQRILIVRDFDALVACHDLTRFDRVGSQIGGFGVLEMQRALIHGVRRLT